MFVKALIAALLALAVAGSAGAATVFREAKTDSTVNRGPDSPFDPAATWAEFASVGPADVTDPGFRDPDLSASGASDTLELYRRNSRGGRDVDLGAGVASVPEPMAWTMMIVGVGLAGAMLRHRRRWTSLN